MFFKQIAFVALILAPGIVEACREPDNTYGIIFNNGETVTIYTIQSMGEQGTHYFMEEDAPGDFTYTYRSHFDSTVMVKLHDGGMQFVVDTAAVKLDEFQSGDCVKAELDWLVENDILDMDANTREKIGRSFGENGGGGDIYWTQQDTLMHSSYSFDDRGNILPLDCGSSEFVQPNLPPQSLSHASGTQDGSFRQRPALEGKMAGVRNRGTEAYIDMLGRTVDRQAGSGIHEFSAGVLIRNDRDDVQTKRVFLPRK